MAFTPIPRETGEATDAAFVMNNYHQKETFASFLPGIAGPNGTPTWCFYVNRGQGVFGFGHTDKNHPIHEFRPADQAYRDVSRLGFRTFIRFEDGQMAEPFGEVRNNTAISRTMTIHTWGFIIAEESGGLTAEVTYGSLPGEKYPALIRCLKIRNTSLSRHKLEVLDGLPRIVPYGIGDGVLKGMSTTGAAWIQTIVKHPVVPEYRIRASMEDTVEVSPVNGCHFSAAVARFADQDSVLEILVDPSTVFGSDTSLGDPVVFRSGGLKATAAHNPVLLGRYPSAFAGVQVNLEPGAQMELHSIYGFAGPESDLGSMSASWNTTDWFRRKFSEYRKNVTECTAPFTMVSGLPSLDAYTGQTALDNTLRGGMPRVWKEGGSTAVFHFYSRKHGDMERDYNDFSLPASRYSAGFGNYRDMNQNRRIDVAMNPDVGVSDIRLFMDLLRPDGYNPLIVQAGVFRIQGQELPHIIRRYPELKNLLSGQFRPGDLLDTGLADDDIAWILLRSDYLPETFFGEGYWVDHWTYNLDLIQQYLRIFPDREEEFFFGKAEYRWYAGGPDIRPLHRRYHVEGGSVRTEDHLEDHGRIERFLKIRSKLFEKLATVAIVKCATLAPGERGIEMEAGRPGWYDALNGMPGQFGSSLSDSAELLRLLKMLIRLTKNRENREIRLFQPAWELMESLFSIEEEVNPALRWRRRWEARDAYRAAMADGDAVLRERRNRDLLGFLSLMERKLEMNLAEATAENGGLMPTYYRFTATGWKEESNGYAIPTSFEPKVLPLFLEGVVKQMKIARESSVRQAIHRHVLASPLYDRDLGMFILNDSLEDEPPTIGRAKAFPDGWLENGSIWLHMEYKYLLELLRSGSGEQFWDAARKALIPFLDPEVYGRSTYENSSFIASSRYPEPSQHGRGFVGRLSGATAEYLTMWHEFLLGQNPFKYRDGSLVFRPEPVLPGDLFNHEGILEFRLFGSIHVIYINRIQADLFPERGFAIDRIIIEDGSGSGECRGEIVGQDALRLRNREFDRITVEFTTQ